MRLRHAVLLTSSKSSHPTQLPSRQHIVRITSLDATLTRIGGRGPQLSSEAVSPSLALTLSATPYPLFFHSLAHSPTQRHRRNSFPVNQLRTLFIATEGVPPGVPLSPHLGSRHSTPIVTLYVQRSFLPYLVTSLLRSLSARFACLLLHCSPHGSPTPRPTLPCRSPLARRDRARHSRLAAFHRSAPA